VPYLAPLPPNRVLSTFGILMAIVETLNSLGVSLSSNPSSSHSSQAMGSHLTQAALVIQVIVIIVFMVLAIIFHRRCSKARIYNKTLSTPLITTYVSMSLIFIRCVYRLVEHSGNTTVQLHNLDSLMSLSPMLRYEWFFYVFEALLMLLNSLLWNIWNPGRYLPKNHNVYLARDGITEFEGQVESDHRPLIAKAGSLLTFGLLFRKGHQRSFEELHDYPVTSRNR
jgi:hypothetical protein